MKKGAHTKVKQCPACKKIKAIEAFQLWCGGYGHRCLKCKKEDKWPE